MWSGAAISFPCAATLCMSVSHMTSFIPLARASCDLSLATSSSSSAMRPSGRVSAGVAPFSEAAAGLGWTKYSQSRRSSSRGYAATDSCVVPCRNSVRDGKFFFVLVRRLNTPFVRVAASSLLGAFREGVPRACAERALPDAPESRSLYPHRGARDRRGLAASVKRSSK